MREFLMLAATISGCCFDPWGPGTTLDPQVVGHGDTTGTWPREVEAAIYRWSDGLGPDCPLQYTVVKGGERPVKLVAVDRWTFGSDVTGRWSGDEIFVIQCSRDEPEIGLLMHELGHAMGLGHSSDPQDLMYHISSQILTANDVRRGRVALGCEEVPQ